MLSFFSRQTAIAAQSFARSSSLSTSAVAASRARFTEKEILESILGDSETEKLEVMDYPHMVTSTGHLKDPVWTVLRHFAHLNLRCVNLSDSSFKLQPNDKLKSLSLARTRLQKLDSVAAVLRRCSMLSVLDLSANSFGKSDEIGALEPLCKHGQLTALSLRGTDLSKAGNDVLDHVLADSTLTRLDLSKTRLTDEQSLRLVELLPNNTQIQELNLSLNPCLESVLPVILAQLSMSSKTSLHSINLLGSGKLTSEVWQSVLELVNASTSIRKIILPEGNDNPAGCMLNGLIKQQQRWSIDTSIPVPTVEDFVQIDEDRPSFVM